MLNLTPKYLREITSLILVLSYTVFHNIILVIIGIFSSLYLINLTYINSNIKSFIKKNQNSINSVSIQKEEDKKDDNIKLAETIEELGFIPSIKTDNERDAA